MDALSPIGATRSSPSPLGKSLELGGGGFGTLLTAAIERADQRVGQADQAVSDVLSGKSDNAHEVMIRLEEAQLALQWTVQIRNKALEAYNEIMRTPI